MARVLFLAVLTIAPAPLLAPAAETLYIAPGIYAPFATEPNAARAEQLAGEARQAAESGQVSRALRLANETLHHDPNEPACRQALGYGLADGRWLTDFQQKQVRRGLVWDSRYGWVEAEDLPRYEAGERRDGRRWLSAEEDAARRATIEDGWRVRTDHFQVTTNHSLEAAAGLAAELEKLFQVWRQLFAGYYLDDEEIRDRFAGDRDARSRHRPFNVIYHRDKQGYVAALRHKQPRIEITDGVYFDDLREAHFFAKGESGAGKAEPVAVSPAFRLSPAAVHEAVHQLFQESQRTRRGVGRDHGYWAVEGVATYFESLAPAGVGRFEIGGAGVGRLPAARARALEGEIVPFESLASLGRDELQRRPDLQAVYSQMAGMATFLMQTETPAGDSRRSAWIRYLRDLYTGRAKPAGLWAELDETPAEVQSAYRRWLAELR